MRKILAGALGTLMAISSSSVLQAEDFVCSDFCKNGQPLSEKATNGSASYCALAGVEGKGCYIGSAQNNRCENHPSIKLCSANEAPESPSEEEIAELRAAVEGNLLSLDEALKAFLPAVQTEGNRKAANAIKAFLREIKKFKRKAELE